MAAPEGAERHEFVDAPHTTFLKLAFPVLLSLIAEPLTGLADTAFVARLGARPLAALGVAVTLLSSLFWVFNFLGIGTQTAVAQALGRRDSWAARRAGSTAAAAALLLGVVVAGLAWPWLAELTRFMGADDAMADDAVSYLRIRFVGAPAVLLLLSAFGALRGLQDMRTPLRIAVTLNALNVVLDYLLIFGGGPVPALGLIGAAWATVASQWFGALWALAAARAGLGGVAPVRLRGLQNLLVVGRDLVARTALLLFFLLLATRAATQLGATEGAAQQAVRQVWMLAAFLLDALAASAQSLVGYFAGAGDRTQARRVAGVATGWAVLAGCTLTLAAAWSENAVARLLLPGGVHAAFAAVWWVAAAAQPLNAVAFVTDGIHWGTGDYRYLRNAMLLATGLGGTLLAIAPQALAFLRLTLPGIPIEPFVWIWIVTDVWIAIRALAGLLRLWPGIGRAPLAGGG